MVRITFLIILSIAVLGILLGSRTNAFFTDSVTSNSNVFAAAAEFPTNTPSPTPPTEEVPASTSASVVINEIMWMGSTANGIADEWIELRNTTDSVVDISGWILENAGDGTPSPHLTIPASQSIPANGFYLIANNTATASNINVTPDFQTVDVELVNGGEQLILKNGSTVIDTANGTSVWFSGINTAPLKRSMERKSPPADGTLGSNWGNSTVQVNLDAGSVDFASPKAANGI